MNRFAIGTVALISLIGFASCKHENPNFEYMPDMAYSPALKAQQHGAQRLPVEGTVARGYQGYAYKKEQAAQAEAELVNPLTRSPEVLKRGQAVYNIYCMVCHGPTGTGNGSVVPPFPAPPSLHSDKIRNMKDGGLYHIIMTGGPNGIMPPYFSQVVPADRWAAIHYIRVLQRSQAPTPEDVRAAEQEEAQ